MQIKELINIMIENMNYLLSNENIKNISAPYTPKSKAKDINGIRQKLIMKLIKEDNLWDSSNKFLKLLKVIYNSKGSENIIHMESKAILKKEII